MTQTSILGIFLAAGKSSRMGKNKLKMQIEQETIGSLSLKAAIKSKLDSVLVITKEGDSLDWIDRELFQEPNRSKWTQVISKEAIKGQSYSIKTGIQTAKGLGAAGIVIILADQPFVRVEMINALIDQYRYQRVDFVASQFNNRIQPPILFSEELFRSLMQLKGDKGARAIIRKDFYDKGIVINYTDGKCFYDIDTEEDYRRLKEVNH
ncbi:NTP transferase domain-containing protein [Aquibacillus halophilus]|uniref:NTP transferase domain-containing protein n=1 Tax=Aquibacillus halophilus TaxID=930132 RepID=A0A6A8DIQ9_9BACI|nr:NTP transferase domain-containing protein [Aquibacillus halophilus]MRH44346.1 NTP transferase domain-containing protein [Aquibacillus halophilus]